MKIKEVSVHVSRTFNLGNYIHEFPDNGAGLSHEEPMSQPKNTINLSFSPEDVRTARQWRCAGCGAPSPDRMRSCSCATSVVISDGPGGRLSEWKEEEPSIEATDIYREKLARWMIDHSFATGHGDTFDDLLKELAAQIQERIERTAELTARSFWLKGTHVYNSLNLGSYESARIEAGTSASLDEKETPEQASELMLKYIKKILIQLYHSQIDAKGKGRDL